MKAKLRDSCAAYATAPFSRYWIVSTVSVIRARRRGITYGDTRRRGAFTRQQNLILYLEQLL